MKFFVFIGILLMSPMAMADPNISQLSPKDVRVSPESGSALVTSGRCQGLVGNSFNHAAVRCYCLILLGAKVAGNGSVDTRGIREATWNQCVADGLQNSSRATLQPSDKLGDDGKHIIKEANRNKKRSQKSSRKPVISDGE